MASSSPSAQVAAKKHQIDANSVSTGTTLTEVIKNVKELIELRHAQAMTECAQVNTRVTHLDNNMQVTIDQRIGPIVTQRLNTVLPAAVGVAVNGTFETRIEAAINSALAGWTGPIPHAFLQAIHNDIQDGINNLATTVNTNLKKRMRLALEAPDEALGEDDIVQLTVEQMRERVAAVAEAE